MNEAFGFLPARPDTEEFWRLSELVLRLDGRMEATPRLEKERVFKEAVQKHIGIEEITYMAMQRAMRLYGITTQSQLLLHLQEVTKATSLYIDAFVLGCEWKSQ